MEGNHGGRPALGWNGPGSAEEKLNASIALCGGEGGGLVTDGLGEPVGASARPDPDMQEARGANEDALKDFRRQWLEDIEQSKPKGNDDGEGGADMSIAQAFEQRDRQARLRRRVEEEPMPQRTALTGVAPKGGV